MKETIIIIILIIGLIVGLIMVTELNLNEADKKDCEMILETPEKDLGELVNYIPFCQEIMTTGK